jgi:hypothetical protein
MHNSGSEERRHESLDHVNPTDEGMMDPDPRRKPATGVMGDETLIRSVEGDVPSYPGLDSDDDHQSRLDDPDPAR